MEDMWQFRDKPVPLDFDLIQSDQLQTNGVVDHPTNSTSLHTNGCKDVSMHQSTSRTNGNSPVAIVNDIASRPGHGLKDQRSLSLRENLILFVSRLNSWISILQRCTDVVIAYSTERLAERLISGNEETISFDKDDDDTLDFVTAAANLRSAAYGIPGKSRWEVKGATGPSSVFLDPIIESVSRNGGEYNTRDRNNQRNYFRLNRATGTAPTARSLWFHAKRTRSIQAFRPSERRQAFVTEPSLRDLP